MEHRTLYKLRQGRIIAGVCAGIGEYANIDVNVVRILAVILGFSGAGLIAYIIAAIILPEK